MIEAKGIKAESRTAKNVKGVRTYSEVHEFVADERFQGQDGQWAIGSHSSLPLIGDLRSAHFTDTDSEAWCDSITPKCTNGFAGWEVTVTWTTEDVARDANGNPQSKSNPLAEPAKHDWSGEQFQRPAVDDIHGDMIGNAAGDPYDPPEMIDDSRLVVRVEKNVAAVPAWVLQYQDAVNSAAFTVDGFSVAQHKAKFQRLQLSRTQVRNGTVFRVLKFELHLREYGWRLRPLNQGFRNIEGDAIQLPDGTYPTSPVPLLADGTDRLDPPSLQNANYGDHEVYQSRDFNNLPLT